MVECLTCSDGFNLQFDAGKTAEKTLYPGIYRASVDLSDAMFQAVHYFSVYAGMDTVRLSAFGKSLTGMQCTSGMRISVFPNPAVSVVNIDSDFSMRAQIELRDISGKLILKTTRNLPATINLNGLRGGLYLLMVVSPQGISTTKLIKM